MRLSYPNVFKIEETVWWIFDRYFKGSKTVSTESLYKITHQPEQSKSRQKKQDQW